MKITAITICVVKYENLSNKFFSSILSFIDKGRTGCHRGEVFNNFPKKLSLFEMENALNKPPLFLPDWPV
jgi:hypothetical protein